MSKRKPSQTKKLSKSPRPSSTRSQHEPGSWEASQTAASPPSLVIKTLGKISLSQYFLCLFSILIFIVGAYFGSKYLSWDSSFAVTGNSTKPVSWKSSTRSVVSVSRPEDYYPAAEFRPQAAILLGCQSRLPLLPELYAEIAKAVNRKVPLFGVVNSEMQALDGVKLMAELGLPPDLIRFVVLPSNSIWIRDYAPLILRYDEGRAIMVDAKYHNRSMRENRKKDDFMGFEMARLLDLPVRSIPLLLEGGNLVSNGEGMLFTTNKTVRANAAGEYTAKQIGMMFNDFLGVSSVFTVSPLIGEPNGHTDMFMTMLSNNLAVICEIDPAVDPANSALLNENAKLISSVTSSAGPVVVKRIPMPPRSGEHWRSYTNVIMANGVLLMPSFSDVDPALEARAEEVYRSCLPPGWEVKRINCDKLVNLNGQLHCISYNIPNFVSIEGLSRKAFPQTNIIE
jgi:agmatine/peptidylarginine deiminase